MGFDKSLFSHFSGYCTEKFGVNAGKTIFAYAENKLSAMKCEADYRGNKQIKWHMDKNMLPVIAIYLTFKQFDRASSSAFEYTDEVMQIFRLKAQKKNRIIGGLPFGYFLFKTFGRAVVSKQYPHQGWNIEWKQRDNKEVCFHMKSCIYVETTEKYGCEELCSLFCKNDDVVLAGYKPAIVFERNETIAGGNSRCDFHFKNPKQMMFK